MRHFAVLAVLSMACAAQAQSSFPKPMVVRPPASAEDRDEREPSRRERERQEQRARKQGSTPPLMVVRPPSEPERDPPRETRPVTKMAPPGAKPPTPPLMVVRPAEPPATPPSKAEQMQRRMDEERRLQRGERVTSSGSFRCTAYPVCDRSSGSYGSCRGVEQVYSANSARFARQQVARDCTAINTPDPCNCAAQCSRVAQCGPL